MRNVLIVMMLLALGACSARAMQATPAQSAADASVEAALATARMLYNEGDYADAQAALGPAVQPLVLDRFSASRRREVIVLYAQSAWWGGDNGKAHWAWQIATQDPAASSDDWQGRLMAATAVLDNADAYVAFDHLRQTAPDAIRAITPQLLEVMGDGFGVLPNADTAQLQLAQLLLSSSRTDPRADFSQMWLRAAAISLDRGDRDAAANYARRITDPIVMVELRADRRFDGLVASDPATFDVGGLARAELAKAEALAEAHPEQVAPNFEVGAALFNLGRYADALAALDTGLAKAPAYGEDRSIGLSLAARKATVLNELGRYDEAIAVTSGMCAVCGGGGGRLEQAHLLIGLNRPAEALALLPKADEPVLGVAAVGEFAAERACADKGVGRPADAARELAFLEGHLRFNPDAAIGALLCAGSDDDVAQVLVTMLADGAMRDVALRDLQTYDEGKLPAFTLQLRARLARIAARPEVQAAVNEAGRVATWHMPRYAILG